VHGSRFIDWRGNITVQGRGPGVQMLIVEICAFVQKLYIYDDIPCGMFDLFGVLVLLARLPLSPS
jgi:hypothetical protein